MSKQKFSPQAVKILAVTIVCMAIMLGVSAVNKARGGERLVREYTVTQGLPRHVKYENMPSDEAQLAAAWDFKYMGLAQFDMCPRLFHQDQPDSLNFEQNRQDYEEGRYIREYIVHSFETLPTVEYGDRKTYYDEKARSCGYKEYQVVRVHFSQKWSDKALERAPQWGDGEFTRDFAVGKETGLKSKWKIFELGMM